MRARCQSRCERCGVPARYGHVHHRRTRSVRDLHTHCPCNLVLLCTDCHTWAHAHPLNARLSGFIVSAAETEPITVSLLTPWGERRHDHVGAVLAPSVTDDPQ